MTYQCIEFSIANNVAQLTLNRPDKLNSFNEQMHQELRQVLAIVSDRSHQIRCLLITGHGRGFCAGQDLGDAHFSAETAADLGDILEKNYNQLIRTITSLEMPVVCAVNGVAAGAGANFALACDLVVAKHSASFLQPFVGLGLIPDAGGTWILPRLVGRQRALGMAMLADKICAEQAQQWGMIWRSIADHEFDSEVTKLVNHLATQPTRALALMKKAFNTSSTNTLDEQLDLERDLQRLAGQTRDYQEGVSAFLAKRKATFTGK